MAYPTHSALWDAFVLGEDNPDKALQYLITEKVTPNCTDHWGQNILMLAVYHKKIKIANYLILNKIIVNINLQDRICGNSTLHYAARYIPGLIKILHNKYPDMNIDISNHDGDTPLHVAEHVESVKKLLEIGAQINSSNEIGRTPYHCAMIRGKEDIAKFLREIGCDITARDNQGDNGDDLLKHRESMKNGLSFDLTNYWSVSSDKIISSKPPHKIRRKRRHKPKRKMPKNLGHLKHTISSSLKVRDVFCFQDLLEIWHI
jgi:ankyrin repeat protein